MQDRPGLTDLLNSVRHFLETEAVPAFDDARLRFRARVAANVLAVAAREVDFEAENLRREIERLEGLIKRTVVPGAAGDVRATVEDLNARLVQFIRSGEIAAAPGTALWEHLRQTAVEKLRITNPGYLRRVGEESPTASSRC